MVMLVMIAVCGIGCAAAFLWEFGGWAHDVCDCMCNRVEGDIER